MNCKTEEQKAKARAYQLAWYHRTKHLRGIKSRSKMSREEKKARQLASGRRLYARQRAALGLSVKKIRNRKLIPLEVLGEILKAENRMASARYRKNNAEKRRVSARDWARRNRKATLEKIKERYRSDTVFNITTKLRSRVRMSINRAANCSKMQKFPILIGCDYRFLKKYIEDSFLDGMTWDGVSKGMVHLDHVVPVSAFNLFDLEEQRMCFNYRNIQPLWAIDNLTKHDSIPEVLPDWIPVHIQERIKERFKPFSVVDGNITHTFPVSMQVAENMVKQS